MDKMISSTCILSADCLMQALSAELLSTWVDLAYDQSQESEHFCHATVKSLQTPL